MAEGGKTFISNQSELRLNYILLLSRCSLLHPAQILVERRPEQSEGNESSAPPLAMQQLGQPEHAHAQLLGAQHRRRGRQRQPDEHVHDQLQGASQGGAHAGGAEAKGCDQEGLRHSAGPRAHMPTERGVRVQVEQGVRAPEVHRVHPLLAPAQEETGRRENCTAEGGHRSLDDQDELRTDAAEPTEQPRADGDACLGRCQVSGVPGDNGGDVLVLRTPADERLFRIDDGSDSLAGGELQATFVARRGLEDVDESGQ